MTAIAGCSIAASWRMRRVAAALTAAMLIAACAEPTKPQGGQAPRTTVDRRPSPACLDTQDPSGFRETVLPDGDASRAIAGAAPSGLWPDGLWLAPDGTAGGPGAPAPARLTLARPGAAGWDLVAVAIGGTGPDASVANADWEDLDSRPGPPGGPATVVIPDLGDRLASGLPGARPEPYRIHWFGEDAIRTTAAGGLVVPRRALSTVDVRYADGRRRNVEATFVDPPTGDLYLVVANDVNASEDGIDVAGQVLRIPAALLVDDGDGVPDVVTPRLVTSLSLDDSSPTTPKQAFTADVLGADMSPDGHLLVLKTRRRWFLWHRSDTATPVASMLAVDPPDDNQCSPPGPVVALRVQPALGSPGGLGGGEAITFTSDSSRLVTVLHTAPALVRTYPATDRP